MKVKQSKGKQKTGTMLSLPLRGQLRGSATHFAPKQHSHTYVQEVGSPQYILTTLRKRGSVKVYAVGFCLLLVDRCQLPRLI